MALPARQLDDQESAYPENMEGKIADSNDTNKELQFRRSLRQAQRSDANNNLDENKNKLEKTGQAVQATGKTAQLAGAGVQAAGTGVKIAGQVAEPIASATGAGVGGAIGAAGGAAAGAIAGSIVPGAGTLAGAAAGARAGAGGGSKIGKTAGQATAKGVQMAGQATEKAGKGVRQAGSKINQSGKNIKSQGRLLRQLRRLNQKNEGSKNLTNLVTQPAQKLSGSILKQAWLHLVSTWGLSWFYIAFHFIAAYFSPFSNLFVKFGQEWLPASIKKSGAAESIGKKAEIPEIAACGCVGCIWVTVILMVTIPFMVIAYTIMYPLNTLGLVATEMWEYFKSWLPWID